MSRRFVPLGATFGGVLLGLGVGLTVPGGSVPASLAADARSGLSDAPGGDAPPTASHGVGEIAEVLLQAVVNAPDSPGFSPVRIGAEVDLASLDMPEELAVLVVRGSQAGILFLSISDYPEIGSFLDLPGATAEIDMARPTLVASLSPSAGVTLAAVVRAPSSRAGAPRLLYAWKLEDDSDEPLTYSASGEWGGVHGGGNGPVRQGGACATWGVSWKSPDFQATIGRAGTPVPLLLIKPAG